MDLHSNNTVFRRFDLVELPFCLTLNRSCRHLLVKATFATISRLGNGVFWYTLLTLILVTRGTDAISPVLQITLTGLTGVLIYKLLKERLARERPYFSSHGIECGALPLDRYSFPSGHTLHAVSFSTVLIAYDPALTWLVSPFTVLVGLSRVILGLHYPSDVLAGGMLGLAIGVSSLQFFPF